MKFRFPNADIATIENSMELLRKRSDNEAHFTELASLFPSVVASLKGLNVKTTPSSTPKFPQTSQEGPSLRKNKGDIAPFLLSNQSEEPLKRPVRSLTGRTSSFSTPKSATAMTFDISHISPPTLATLQLSSFNPSGPAQEFDATVNKGLYIVGNGKRKVSENPFEISWDEYSRAMAWAQRDSTNNSSSTNHLAYQFKVVKTADVESLIKILSLNGIEEPEVPEQEKEDDEVNGSHAEQAYRQAWEKYNRTVAQAAYKLPTSWPPVTDYWIDLNSTASVLMSPKSWQEPNQYVDVTPIIVKGPNILTLIELADMREYTFCLFEKSPSEQ
ncbi:hypothetical protein CPB86DRAFT_778766 [Serendipita vermifera]|nr:hypothetical protein CPB86DRAFT_778766 [Serendipita vermifera]